MHILKGTKVSMPTQSKLAEKGGGSEKFEKVAMAVILKSTDPVWC